MSRLHDRSKFDELRKAKRLKESDFERLCKVKKETFVVARWSQKSWVGNRKAEGRDYLSLKVEAGKTHFLRQKVEAGLWKARTNLVVISNVEGGKKLEDVNLSVFERKIKSAEGQTELLKRRSYLNNFYVFCLTLFAQPQSEAQPDFDENDFTLRRIICPTYANAASTMIATMIA